MKLFIKYGTNLSYGDIALIFSLREEIYAVSPFNITAQLLRLSSTQTNLITFKLNNFYFKFFTNT